MERCYGRNFWTCVGLLTLLYLARTSSAYIVPKLKVELCEISDPEQVETDSVRIQPDIKFSNTVDGQAQKEVNDDKLRHKTRHENGNSLCIELDIRSTRKPRQHRIHRRSATTDQENTLRKMRNSIWNSRRVVNGPFVRKEADQANHVVDAGMSPQRGSKKVRVVPDISQWSTSTTATQD